MNSENLLTDAYNVNWDSVLSAVDVNTMVDNFNQTLTLLLDKHAPVVTKRITRQPSPWITPAIRQLMARRDSAYRKFRRTKDLIDGNIYKHLRNRTKQELRNSKVRYIYSYFSVNKSSSDRWRMVKRLGVSSIKSESPISVDLNELNNHYINLPVDNSGSIAFANHLATLQLPNDHGALFKFSEISENEVYKSISMIRSNATGADNISIKFLKSILPAILPVITSLLNRSLSTSIFPSAWKSAIVRPIAKLSSPSSPSDYRPISILPAISKCLERIVHQQVCCYLTQNNLLSRFQSGFRSNHSTTTALLHITEDIRKAIDNRQLTLLTLFDFSKAFDCVHHPLLLVKLAFLGFTPDSIRWFESYLSGRQQRVHVNNEYSNWGIVSKGVPQGSVLGPLLFTLYINDLNSTLHYCKYHLYADDLQIYYHAGMTDLNDGVDRMNIDIVSIGEWAHRHSLKLNNNKTQPIIIGNNRLIAQINFNTVPRIIIDNIPLDYCGKVKNLGLLMNTTLSWSDHIALMCNRVFAGIHTLKRYSNCFPIDIKIMLVKTLVFPHFDYCDVVINDMTGQQADRLQRAQNYCLRYIFNLRRDDHISPYFKRLKLLRLREYRKIKVLSLLYNLLQTKNPSYLASNFVFNSSISNRETRQGSSILNIPIHRTALYNKSFTVTACRLWNELDPLIRNAETRARFVAALRDWLLAESWGS